MGTMNSKDRIIQDLREKLEDAEEEIKYNVERKEELKRDLREADKNTEKLEDQLKSANEIYDHYFSQCCSLSRAKNKIEQKLENVNKELIECKEGNYYIQQYNSQLVKARDEVDVKNEKLQQS